MTPETQEERSEPTPPLPVLQGSRISDRWGCVLLALWIYSLIATLTALVALAASPFTPPAPASKTPVTDALTGGLLFLPVFVFVVVVGIRNFRSR